MPRLASMLRRGRGRMPLILGGVTLAVAVFLTAQRLHHPARRVTLTAGPGDTTRAVLAGKLLAAAADAGLHGKLVTVPSTVDEVALADAGTVDFALVSGAFALEAWTHLREVTPLQVEALHLLVKPGIAADGPEGLRTLRGRTVDLGPAGSTSAGLAAAVLAFADLAPGGAAADAPLAARTLDLAELERLLDARDHGALPDVVFHLATLPSRVAQRLVREAGYRLVPLPFAEALRLGSLIADPPPPGLARLVEVEYVHDVVVPGFTYQSVPPVPPGPIHTVGTRLLLVANERVPPDAVQTMLTAVYGPRFARLTTPWLDPGVLAEPPRLPLHPGRVAWVALQQRYVTGEVVDELSNSLSIVGALGGASLFLWQWWRQRRQGLHDAVFGGYVLELAGLERRLAGMELSATLDLEALAELQRDLLRLKTDALDRFAAGELGGQSALSDLLLPLNAARDHVAGLMLHVRDNLEERAESEGKSVEALWDAAIDKAGTGGGSP